MQIIPSILEKTPKALFSQLKKLSPYFQHFQIDIADGIFVPNKTLQIEDIIKSLPNYQLPITNYSLSFDFHLMVKNYKEEIKKLEKLRKSLTIKTVFIHVSLLPNYQFLITNYPHFSFALVLDPKDSVRKLSKHYNLKNISGIQIMSVVPGFQGSQFLPETLNKIEQLRLTNYRNKVYLDGAINAATLPIILAKKYIPDILCPGSFLTKAENLRKNIDILNKKNSTKEKTG